MRTLICKYVGNYPHALKKGSNYVVLEEDKDKEQIRILGEHGKRIWVKKNFFVDSDSFVPILKSWIYDDDISDTVLGSGGLYFIEISFELSDGSKRWCSVCTPETLELYIKNNISIEDYVYIQNLIVTKSFNEIDIEIALRDIDYQDLLIAASKELI
jgi:hypothetical protein